MNTVHDELRALLAADQDDRAGGRLGAEAIDRDRVRLRRVKELLEAGAVENAEDLYCAAMILQHGSLLEDYWQAHQLAKASSEAGHAPARWLAAAAYDRWLMHQGQRQHFGTQYFSMGGGPLRLWEVDRATTDEERARWDVPPLRDALDRVGGQVQPATAITRLWDRRRRESSVQGRRRAALVSPPNERSADGRSPAEGPRPAVPARPRPRLDRPPRPPEARCGTRHVERGDAAVW